MASPEAQAVRTGTCLGKERPKELAVAAPAWEQRVGEHGSRPQALDQGAGHLAEDCPGGQGVASWQEVLEVVEESQAHMRMVMASGEAARRQGEHLRAALSWSQARCAFAAWHRAVCLRRLCGEEARAEEAQQEEQRGTVASLLQQLQAHARGSVGPRDAQGTEDAVHQAVACTVPEIVGTLDALLDHALGPGGRCSKLIEASVERVLQRDAARLALGSGRGCEEVRLEVCTLRRGPQAARGALLEAADARRRADVEQLSRELEGLKGEPWLDGAELGQWAKVAGRGLGVDARPGASELAEGHSGGAPGPDMALTCSHRELCSGQTGRWMVSDIGRRTQELEADLQEVKDALTQLKRHFEQHVAGLRKRRASAESALEPSPRPCLEPALSPQAGESCVHFKGSSCQLRPAVDVVSSPQSNGVVRAQTLPGRGQAVSAVPLCDLPLPASPRSACSQALPTTPKGRPLQRDVTTDAKAPPSRRQPRATSPPKPARPQALACQQPGGSVPQTSMMVSPRAPCSPLRSRLPLSTPRGTEPQAPAPLPSLQQRPASAAQRSSSLMKGQGIRV